MPEAWRLRGAPWPAIRRGLWVATPVGLAILLDLEVDTEVAAGFGTAAMICGFIAFDAPARVRVRWQLCCAPLMGLAAAVGVLSSATDATAVIAMLAVAGVSGYLVAVSLRLAIAGLSWTLAVVIAQGLFLDPSDATAALLFGTAGGVTQAAFAGIAWALWDREREPGRVADLVRAGLAKLRAAASRRDASARHAVRFGLAMGLGVAIYRFGGFDDHGYWVPLTILFVLKPDPDQTSERIAMRAAGTLVGLVLATALAELLVNDVAVTAAVLFVSAALAYALLAIEYALFTTAITIFVVLLTDALGNGPLDTAGQRALGTLLGIAVAAVAFRVLGDVVEDVEEAEDERGRSSTRGINAR